MPVVNNAGSRIKADANRCDRRLAWGGTSERPNWTDTRPLDSVVVAQLVEERRFRHAPSSRAGMTLTNSAPNVAGRTMVR